VKRSFPVVPCLAVVILLACSYNPLSASDQSDYSGTYKTQQARNKGTDSPSSTIHVVQSNEAIEITKIEDGKRTSNRFLLDGSEGSFISSGGVTGKGKAAFKEKELVLEYVVVAPKNRVTIHTRERWRLSPDRKVLTIRFKVTFPDADPMVRGAVEAAIEPWTEKYVRADTP
jgi:hypothetical protein